MGKLRSVQAAVRITFIIVAATGMVVGQQPPQQNDTGSDWPMYARDYGSTRFSPLNQLTAKNVSSLKEVCSFALPETATFESSLLAVGESLYFTTSAYTYAIDAANCTLKWRVQHEVQGPGGTVRGAAIAGNRIYRGFRDGFVISYDIANGEQIWATKLTAPDGRVAIIAASPVVWNGLVFIGTSGAEQNCACFIAALDAATGRAVWTFNSVPDKNGPGTDSWPKTITPGGGSTWTNFSIDTVSGALYLSTGNPGYDFAENLRPGANLYTNSVVVLDAKTGSLRKYYQIVPHDYHDWDLTAAPVVITTRSGARRALAVGKDGFLDAIDITAEKIAWKTPVTTIENTAAPLKPEGTHFCPGVAGGVQWNGPAYSPVTNLLYVNSVDWCSTLKLDSDFDGKKNFLGSANAFGDRDSSKTGWTVAVDADSGAVRWKYRSSSPMVAGIAATATGLVFTADLGTDLLAFDAAKGTLLARISLGQPTGGGVITYMAGGKQRVAVATGLEDRIMQTQGHPTIVVLGL